MQVTVVGAGYVGLSTGVALAYLGHQVILLDKNPDVIYALKNGKSKIYEYGMEALMRAARDNISYTSSFTEIKNSEIVFIAVGTPSKSNGDADLGFVESAALEIASQLDNENPPPVIVNKSTSPPGTAYRLRTLVNNTISRKELQRAVKVASNPEFLRESNALFDVLYPDRIVLGANEQSTFAVLEELYYPVIEQNFSPPDCLPRPEDYTGPALIKTDPITAELTKYAANAFLSMKISFINEFAGLAELLGADITEVARGIGLDKRIGNKFLQAGAGWGGSCFGKDARAIIYTAKKYGYSLPLVEAAMEVNLRQRNLIISKIVSVLKTIPGSTIGILGLAFKPGTNDVRDAPATDVICQLLNMGAFVKACDPMAMENYKKQHPDLAVEYTADLETLASGCDALVLLTEWEQFKNAPWGKIRRRMKNNVFIDGRNLLDPQLMIDSGFVYRGVGRRLTPVRVEP